MGARKNRTHIYVRNKRHVAAWRPRVSYCYDSQIRRFAPDRRSFAEFLGAICIITVARRAAGLGAMSTAQRQQPSWAGSPASDPSLSFTQLMTPASARFRSRPVRDRRRLRDQLIGIPPGSCSTARMVRPGAGFDCGMVAPLAAAGSRVAAQACSFVNYGAFAIASRVSASTRAPAAKSAGVALSASLWLTPPAQGTKIMPVGATLAMCIAS